MLDHMRCSPGAVHSLLSPQVLAWGLWHTVQWRRWKPASASPQAPCWRPHQTGTAAGSLAAAPSRAQAGSGPSRRRFGMPCTLGRAVNDSAMQHWLDKYGMLSMYQHQSHGDIIITLLRHGVLAAVM